MRAVPSGALGWGALSGGFSISREFVSSSVARVLLRSGQGSALIAAYRVS
jgi:hypothetical protein